LDVIDAVLAQRVGQGLAQRLGDLIAHAQRRADGELAEPGERRIVAIVGEDIEAGRYLAPEEIGLGEAQVHLFVAQRDDGVEAQILPAAEEISLVNADVGSGPSAVEKPTPTENSPVDFS